MSEQERPGPVKPPLAWPKTGVIDVNYSGEL
jgi:hypothetical protein